MQAKRLARYPIQVRNIKRLRRQVSGLNRCIRSEKEYGEWMSQNLTKFTKDCMNNYEPNNNYIMITGIVCFILGILVGA